MAVDGRFSRKKVLIGRNSRGTPCSSANEIKRRAAKACTKNKKRQFHTGNLERQNKEIRRASEQTSPPGGLRSRTPSDGTRRRIEQWQLAQSAVSVSGARIRPKNGKKKAP
jgi:hypothetical protein